MGTKYAVRVGFVGTSGYLFVGNRMLVWLRNSKEHSTIGLVGSWVGDNSRNLPEHSAICFVGSWVGGNKVQSSNISFVGNWTVDLLSKVIWSWIHWMNKILCLMLLNLKKKVIASQIVIQSNSLYIILNTNTYPDERF